MIRRRYKILAAVFAVIGVAAAVGAFAVSSQLTVRRGRAVAGGRCAHEAVVQPCYGPPEVLRYDEVAKPVPGENEVLVKVRAASVNPADWHGLTGTPYIAARPSTGFGAPGDIRFGADYAGVVEAVGKNVTTFKPGDEVFGARGRRDGRVRHGAHGSVRFVLKPANITFEQAAAIPIAAVTALQGLRDSGQLTRGTKSADQRRVRRRGHVRSADREGARRRSHRRLQHAQRRARPLARR